MERPNYVIGSVSSGEPSDERVKKWIDELMEDANALHWSIGVNPEWADNAARAIRFHAKACRRRFLVEEVARGYRDPPPDGRAWGAAVRLAQRNGWIRAAGYLPAQTSHRSPKTAWVVA